MHLSAIHLEGILPRFAQCTGINPHRKKYMARESKLSLFSKTSHFVNTVFKGRECFVWLTPTFPLLHVFCVVRLLQIHFPLSLMNLWSSILSHRPFYSITAKRYILRRFIS